MWHRSNPIAEDGLFLSSQNGFYIEWFVNFVIRLLFYFYDKSAQVRKRIIFYKQVPCLQRYLFNANPNTNNNANPTTKWSERSAAYSSLPLR